VPTRLPVVLALLLTTPLWALPTRAQKATEQYIPVGRSPGLSGESTLVGRIVAVDADYRSLRISGPRGEREVAVADSTTIWLDRTPLGRTNTRGTLDDCREQRVVEVKLADDGQVAEWIKVQMTAAPGP
jgi:hypothetical protein